jgi:hypothetical protein
MSGDDAVVQDPPFVELEILRAVRDDCVELDERAKVQEDVESFASRQLALLVLTVDAVLAAGEVGQVARRPKTLDAHVRRACLLAGRESAPFRCLCAKTVEASLQRLRGGLGGATADHVPGARETDGTYPPIR